MLKRTKAETRRSLFLCLFLLGLIAAVVAIPYHFGTEAAGGQHGGPKGLVPGQGLVPADVDCSKIQEKHIDVQENLAAGAILAYCGWFGPDVKVEGMENESEARGGDRYSDGGGDSPFAYGGTDQNVHPNSSTNIQSESFVFGDGANTIIATYNDLGTCTGGSSRSTDGGATWARIAPGGVNPFCSGHGTNFGDPVGVFDKLHNAWSVQFLASGCGGQGVGAWKSTDGGATWTVGGCINGSQLDRNSGWADNNSSSPFYGRIYASWNDFSIGGGALRTAWSTDTGATWSTPATVFASFRRDIQLTGDPSGTNGYVYLGAMDEGGGGAANRTNYMFRSTDGGVTWNAGVSQGAAFAPPGNSNCAGNSYFRVISTGSSGLRHMGWGQPAVGASGVVHYVYAQHGAATDEGDIMYVRSTDAGATWSAPLMLNTDAPAGTRAQWMPSISASPSGQVFVKWYDRRDTANNDYWIYGRASLDNGVSWQPDQAVSDAVIPQPLVQTGNCYMGDYDYHSSTGTSNQALMTWTDSRGSGGGGTQDVYFDKNGFGFAVNSSNPACDSIVNTQLTSFVINFSDPAAPGTVQASDFTVNAIPATSVVLSAGNQTATFTFAVSPVVTQGPQAMHIAAGAINRASDNNPILDFACNFRYDTLALAVTSTVPAVGGVFTPAAPNDYTYDVNFNEAVNPASVSTGDLSVSGTSGPSVSAVTVINANMTARFTLHMNFGGTVNASIAAGAVTDTFGNPNQAFSGAYTVAGCAPQDHYNINQIGGATIVPGTTDTGNHTDDGTTAVALPFSFSFYDQTYSSVNVDSNGTAQFAGALSTFTNTCLPYAAQNYVILPYWDDLRTDAGAWTCTPGPCGIYTSTSGSVGSRIFNIEWRAVYYNAGSGTGNANFELRLYEGTPRFDVIYGSVTNTNTTATAGTQKNPTTFDQYFCNGAGGAATGGQSYTLPTCGTPSPTPTGVVPTPTPSVNPTPSANPSPSCNPVALTGDDGTVENSIGWTDATNTQNYGAVWISRFTPTASYPFTLNQIRIMWPNSAALVGKAITLLVYTDTDGNNNPNNAVLVRQQNATIGTANGTTFNDYTLTSPVLLTGPGDVYIGFKDTYNDGGVSPTTFPAPLDTSATANRSWLAGNDTAAVVNINNLGANDELGTLETLSGGSLTGNWVIRGVGVGGACGTPNPTPSVNPSPSPTSSCGPVVTTWNPSSGLPAAIPDNVPAGVDLPITVSGLTGTLQTVRVQNFTWSPLHSWGGDITVTLKAPGGSPTATIHQRRGQTTCGTGFGSSADLTGPYNFGDAFSNNFHTMAGDPVPSGDYRATQCVGTPGELVALDTIFGGPVRPGGGQGEDDSMAVFNGMAPEAANGTWTLNISDNAGGDTGTVSAVQLRLQSQGGACGTPSPAVSPTASPAPSASPTCNPTGGAPGPWSNGTTGPPTRYRAGGVTDGTNIYVFGGSNAAAAYLNDLWRWSPATGTWTQLANMPTGKSNMQGAYYNGKIYVPGGYIGSHITENAIYDIASNAWTTGAPLPAAQSGQTVAFNGKIYNFGGNPGPQTTVSIYDIAGNSWSTGAPMPVATTYGRAIRVGNFAYYVGGIAAATTNAVFRYDFAANTWTTMASLQTARTSEELATDGTSIFAIMGGDATFFTGVPQAQSVEIYNIATNTWTYAANQVGTKAAAPSGGGAAGGKLMVQGGVDSTVYYDLVQVSTLAGGGGCPTPSPAVSPTVNPSPTPATLMQFSSSTYSRPESLTATITVTRTGQLAAPDVVSTVNFATVAGGSAVGGASCTNGVDYITTSGTLTFQNGESSKTFDITTCQDGLVEGNETVNLALSNPTNGGLGNPSTAVLTITDTANVNRNLGCIDINQGTQSPGSPITVVGGPVQIGTVRVTLFDMWHSFPDNVDVLLVGPQGHKYMLMADAGGPIGVPQNAPVTLTFVDSAAAAVPNNGPLVTANVKPASWEAPQSSFAPPAPAAPYIEPNGSGIPTLNSTFAFSNSNGTWTLYVRDDAGTIDPNVLVGQICGWGIDFPTPTAAGVSLSGRVTTAGGNGIRNARVTIAGNSLPEARVVTTGSFGYFSFEGLTAGETYVVTVNSQRYVFQMPSRVVTLNDNLTDFDFVAEPNESR